MYNNTIRNSLTAAVGAGLLVAVVQLPASAAPEAGDPVAATVSIRPGECRLERVGTRYVRCDDLTGAGATAPAWVPERAVLSTSAARPVVPGSSGEVQPRRSLLP